MLAVAWTDRQTAYLVEQTGDPDVAAVVLYGDARTHARTCACMHECVRARMGDCPLRGGGEEGRGREKGGRSRASPAVGQF